MNEALDGITHLVARNENRTHVLIEFETNDGSGNWAQPKQFIADRLATTQAIVYKYPDGQIGFALFMVSKSQIQKFERELKRHYLELDSTGLKTFEDYFAGIGLQRS